MKTLIALLLMLMLSLTIAVQAIATDGKITICHHTGSQSNPTVTITVSENAWDAHQKHGDTKGPCPASTTTPKPSDTPKTPKPSDTPATQSPSASQTQPPLTPPTRPPFTPTPSATAPSSGAPTASPASEARQLPSTATESGR